MRRRVAYFTSEAVAAGGVVVSPWFRVAHAVDAGDSTLTRKPEAYPFAFLRGHVAIAVSSAADGLQLQETEDQVTILTVATTTLTVAAPGTLEQFRFSFAMGPSTKFARVRFVNGVVALAAATWALRCWPDD